MSKKEEKAREYAENLMNESRPYYVEKYGMERAKRMSDFDIYHVEQAYTDGWDEALKNILVDASKELPEYDINVWVINEKGEQFYCHRSKNKRVKAYKDEWCNYTGSDIIAWIRPISFEEILKLNKDVLERLKK